MSLDGYRFGFNGKEQILELSNDAVNYDYGLRMYNPLFGRWLSSDPLSRNYSSLSVYNFCSNNPLYYLDLFGKDIVPCPEFSVSRYGSIYNNLILNSPTYVKIIQPYQQSSLDLEFDINDAYIEQSGKFAVTKSPKKNQNTNLSNGQKEPVILTSNTTIFFSNELASVQDGENKNYTYKVNKTDIFIAATIIHESLHALVEFDQKDIFRPNNSNSGGHTELNNYHDLMVNALSEYVKNNNLNYTVQDIEDISWHGTDESIQFISHFEELAKKNGTTKNEEIDLWRKRVSQLSHSYTNIVKKTEVDN